MKRLAAAAILLLIAAGVASACSIPVFRYALERWELSAYEIIVYHKGPLGAETLAAIKKIENGTPANIRVETIDIGKEVPKSYKTLLERHGKDQPLPWVAVRLADAEPKSPPAWSGPFDANALGGVIESPVRHRLVERLKNGPSGVFLFLESGDKAADDAARALLEKELTRLEKAVPIPEQSEEGPQLKTALPLKVSFPIVRMRRDDPAEQQFLKILLNTEDDLEKVKGPMILPIFGRGRLLCSVYDKDINATQIGNVARFLCGACSCQVKELNPGVDLIMPANWQDILEKIGPPVNPRPDTPSPKKKGG